jgi:catechol 2,3-dioxygenase-like lactoylglutathione lyase family enzyme
MRTTIAAVITAVHTIVYTSDPEATRAFFRDVLEFPFVDTGGGWLIFRTGPSELGVHPSAWEHDGQLGGTDQQFEVSLICDDLSSTMAELTAKGAQFSGDIEQAGWGSIARLLVPGAAAMTLYQPRYEPPAMAHEGG